MKRIKPKAPTPLTLKARVTTTYNPALQGVITQLGPEVSEVKWDGGVVRFVPNNLLRATEGEQTQ